MFNSLSTNLSEYCTDEHISGYTRGYTPGYIRGYRTQNIEINDEREPTTENVDIKQRTCCINKYCKHYILSWSGEGWGLR